jgi:hypothetical protein
MKILSCYEPRAGAETALQQSVDDSRARFHHNTFAFSSPGRTFGVPLSAFYPIRIYSLFMVVPDAQILGAVAPDFKLNPFDTLLPTQ